MLIIDSNDISEIISNVGRDELMDEIIRGIGEFCLHSIDASENRPRDGFHYCEPQPGLLEWMPVFKKGEKVTIKVVGYHPRNPVQFGLPTIIGSIGVYDSRNGCMVALADGTLPTALRTGAASAAASRVLANPESSIIGVIGCGAQAITQCHALIRCFPIDQILVHDSNFENQSSFSSRMSQICPVSVTINTASKAEILANADIICTCTSIDVGQGPLFSDTLDTKDGLHINAVGSDFPGKTELPKSLLQRAVVIPDHLEQCVKEGECQQLGRDEIGPELSQVLKCRDDYQHFSGQLTVFDSTGWAAEDQIMVEILIRHAEDLNLGLSVDLHSLPEDPLNPYQQTHRSSPRLLRKS